MCSSHKKGSLEEESQLSIVRLFNMHMVRVDISLNRAADYDRVVLIKHSQFPLGESIS
jgi:hypothetical protein